MYRPNLIKLFKKDKQSTQDIKPFQIGERFPAVVLSVPLQSSKRQKLFLFISMTCIACINLLPNLKGFSDQFIGNLILVTNGFPEENEEMVKHFDFDMPILTIEDQEYTETYRVPYTPFAYLVDAEGIVTEVVNLDIMSDTENEGL